jgi:hypothetical protein
MKRYLILAGLFGHLIASKASAQDTIKSTTTTTTTITTDTAGLVAPPTPPPAPAAPVVAPAPSESEVDDNADNVPGGYIGFRYMPTFTSFDVKTNNGTAETSFSLGHGAAGYLGTNFSKHTALQLEVMYSQLSQKYSNNDRETRVDLNYVNIPLMFVLNTNITKPVNFNITAGPQVGINVGSKIESDYVGNGADSTTAVLAVKGHDFGIAYGAGFDFRLGHDVQLGLGFRGVHGLLDISDRSRTKATDEYLILDRSYVDTYSAYVGIRFNF